MKPPFGTEVPPKRLQSPIVGGIDIREVAGCTCLRLRRSSREATRLFDAHLSKAGLTIGQFGLMARLYAVGIFRESISIRDLAKLFGMDPTTLVRTLKPLEQQGWVVGEQDPRDRRSRLLTLTNEGRERLTMAMPQWEAAQRDLRESIGEPSALALNGMLDLVAQKLQLDLSALDE
jgi:DNA-binding MarR family transcriptional regulator